MRKTRGEATEALGKGSGESGEKREGREKTGDGERREGQEERERETRRKGGEGEERRVKEGEKEFVPYILSAHPACEHIRVSAESESIQKKTFA